MTCAVRGLCVLGLLGSAAMHECMQASERESVIAVCFVLF